MADVDYAALAKQAGEISSTPAPSAGIDYEALAQQSGALRNDVQMQAEEPAAPPNQEPAKKPAPPAYAMPPGWKPPSAPLPMDPNATPWEAVKQAATHPLIDVEGIDKDLQNILVGPFAFHRNVIDAAAGSITPLNLGIGAAAGPVIGAIGEMGAAGPAIGKTIGLGLAGYFGIPAAKHAGEVLPQLVQAIKEGRTEDAFGAAGELATDLTVAGTSAWHGTKTAAELVTPESRESYYQRQYAKPPYQRDPGVDWRSGQATPENGAPAPPQLLLGAGSPGEPPPPPQQPDYALMPDEEVVEHLKAAKASGDQGALGDILGEVHRRMAARQQTPAQSETPPPAQPPQPSDSLLTPDQAVAQATIRARQIAEAVTRPMLPAGTPEAPRVLTTPVPQGPSGEPISLPGQVEQPAAPTDEVSQPAVQESQPIQAAAPPQPQGPPVKAKGKGKEAPASRLTTQQRIDRRAAEARQLLIDAGVDPDEDEKPAAPPAPPPGFELVKQEQPNATTVEQPTAAAVEESSREEEGGPSAPAGQGKRPTRSAAERQPAAVSAADAEHGPGLLEQSSQRSAVSGQPGLAAEETPAAAPQPWQMTRDEYLANDVRKQRQTAALSDVEDAVKRLGVENLEQAQQIQPGETVEQWIERKTRQTAKWVAPADKPGGNRSRKVGQSAIEELSKPWNIFKDQEGEKQLQKAALAYVRGAKNDWMKPEENFDSPNVLTQAKHEAAVKQALAEGKPVPPEVAAQYPNLQAPAPAPQPEAAPAITAPPASQETPAAAEPAAPAPRKPAKVNAAVERRRDYFTPGNVVTSYFGHDKVLAYDEKPDGTWTATVRAVLPDGSPDPHDDRTRIHSTEPGKDARVISRAPAPQPEAAPAIAETPAAQPGSQEPGVRSQNAAAAAPEIEPEGAIRVTPHKPNINEGDGFKVTLTKNGKQQAVYLRPYWATGKFHVEEHHTEMRNDSPTGGGKSHEVTRADTLTEPIEKDKALAYAKAYLQGGPQAAANAMMGEPSAKRFDEVSRELTNLAQGQHPTAGNPGAAHNARVDLEAQLEHHRPAAEAAAQAEIDREKAKQPGETRDFEIGDLVQHEGKTYEVGYVKRPGASAITGQDANGRPTYERAPATELRLQDPATHAGTLKVSPDEVTAASAEPAPLPANVEQEFAARHRDNLAAARKRGYVDVDPEKVKKTISDLTRQLNTGDSASAQVGDRDVVIHRKKEWEGHGKKRQQVVSYSSFLSSAGNKPTINKTERDPVQAVYWATEALHSLGVRPDFWDDYRYGARNNSAERLVKSGDMLPSTESAMAASDAAAHAIGQPKMSGDIYSQAFAGGWKPGPAGMKFADIAKAYADSLPRNEEPLLERRRGAGVTDDPNWKLLQEREPSKGYQTWENQIEDYERNAKVIDENLKNIRRRIETAKLLNGGTTDRIAESEKVFNDLEANIGKNLAHVRAQAKVETAKDLAETRERVRPLAEAYAKYGEATFPDDIKAVAGMRDPDSHMRRYARLKGLSLEPEKQGGGEHQGGGGWAAVMKDLGIEPQKPPRRVEVPTTGKDKLVKAEVEALSKVHLGEDSVVPGDMGTMQKLQARGWIGDDYKLTPAGESAVYSMRMDAEEAAAGKPIDKYVPKKQATIPGMGDFGNEATAWNTVDGDIWHTEGHGAWKGEFPKNWAPRDKAKPGPNISQVVEPGKHPGSVAPVKPIGFYTYAAREGNQQNVVFDNGAVMSAVNYDYTLHRNGGAVEWRQTSPTSAFFGYDKEGELVAAVMPMKIEEVPEKLKPLLNPATMAAQERTKGKADAQAELKRLKNALADRAEYEKPFVAGEEMDPHARLPVGMTKEEVQARVKELEGKLGGKKPAADNPETAGSVYRPLKQGTLPLNSSPAELLRDGDMLLHRQTPDYPAHLYLNTPMMEILRRSIDPRGNTFGGAVMEPNDVVKAIRELGTLEKHPTLGAKERGLVQQLRAGLIKARAAHGGVMVITQQRPAELRRAVMEEMSHHEWLTGGKGHPFGGIPAGDLFSNQTFVDIVADIARSGYNSTVKPTEAIGNATVEAVAKIGQPWDWQEFGITREQALEAASHIVDVLEKSRGPEARSVVRWWGRGFQKELYDYKTARGWQSRLQSLPRPDQQDGSAGGSPDHGGTPEAESGGSAPDSGGQRGTLTRPLARESRLGDEQPDFLHDEEGSAPADILGLGKFVEKDVAPALRDAAKAIVGSADDILKVLAPTLRGGPKVEEGKLAMRGRLGEMARRTDQARAALAKAETYFSKQPVEDNYEFWDRIESGAKQENTDLDAIAGTLRQLLDGRRADVQALGANKLRNFYENYMPRAWKDPKSALAYIQQFYARRPFEGSKSFLKKRTYPTMAEGRAAGLEPITDNPVTMALLKIAEMDRYIAAHRTLNDWKGSGSARYVDARDEKHAHVMRKNGWQPIADPIGTVYGASVQPITEYPNEGLWNGLQAVAEALNLKQERGFLNLHGAVGRAQQGTGRVQTLHGTAEDVLAHEIGHQIDWLAGSGKRFVTEYPDPETVKTLKDAYATLRDKGAAPSSRTAARKTIAGLKDAIQDRKEFQRQLRALADLRGGDRSYTHKREEKMALLSEMWVGARESFKRTAPKVFKLWKQFLNENPKLHALRDIEGNTEVLPLSQPYDVGGLVIKGNWWAPEGLTRLMGNHLMPGLSAKPMFRGFMALNNHLNLFNLGLSAFHVGKTSFESTISRGALGFEALLRGHPIQAAKFMATAPFAPFTYWMKGDKMLKEWYKPGSQGAEIGALADHATHAGARVHIDDIYRTRIGTALRTALRDGNVIGAGVRLPSAAMEYMTGLIMNEIVPRLKMGVFADMSRFHLAQMGPDPATSDVQRSMANDWNSVENRLGEVTRDNLFWNRYARDLATGLMRADQWFLGTVREVGGGLADAIAQPLRAQQGKPVNWNRMTYLLSMVTFHMLYSALYQYAHTGKGPEELEDYFFPRNGETDEQGKPQRSVLWSYVKDVYGLARHPIQTLQNKAAPALAMFSQLVRNLDFSKTDIREPDDPALQQAADVGKYVAKQYTPFAARNFARERELGAPTELSAEQFVGITPAPSDLDRSPAGRLASELARQNGEAEGRTHEQAARRETLRHIERLAQLGRPTGEEIGKAIQAGAITVPEARRAVAEAHMDPLVRSFKGLGLAEALKVWGAATPEERRKLRPLLLTKGKSLKEKPAAERAVLLPKLVAALRGQ
jgi:hypothetical protein